MVSELKFLFANMSFNDSNIAIKWNFWLFIFFRNVFALSEAPCKLVAVANSLRSKRFRLVSEQRKTEERDFRF